MEKQHDNEFNFFPSSLMKSVSFNYNDEYCVTEGQPWNGVTTVEGNIIVKAGRKGSKKCADWFKDYVGRYYNNMIHTRGGDNLPDELNFAIKGTLTIDDLNFEVCIGQGRCSGENNWHIASKDIVADHDAKNGTLGFKIRMLQDGIHSFKLSKDE